MLTIGPMDVADFFSHDIAVPDGTEVKSVPRDHTSPIWDDTYLVHIPMGATRSMDELEKSGFVMTGIAHVDEEALRAKTVVRISINRMLEIYQAGQPIRIPTERGILDIYEAIQTYLEFWVDRRTHGSVHSAFDPRDDLEDLDEFAESIYARVRHHYNQNNLPYGQESNMLTGQDIFVDIERTVVTKEILEIEELDDRQPLSDLLKNGIKRIEL